MDSEGTCRLRIEALFFYKNCCKVLLLAAVCTFFLDEPTSELQPTWIYFRKIVVFRQKGIGLNGMFWICGVYTGVSKGEIR